MAGSRLEKLGSIFTRVQGLLRSGAVKYEDRPLWFDVYKRFPPKTKPIFGRELPKEEVRTILYSEDVVRARFFDEFTHNPDVVNICDDNKRFSISQRFIHKYQAFKTDNVSEDAAFDMARGSLKAEGVVLKTRQDILNEEAEKLKASTIVRDPKQKPLSQIESAPQKSFTAADLFGKAAVAHKGETEGFFDEEFYNEEVEELLRSEDVTVDGEISNEPLTRKPNKSKLHLQNSKD